MLYMLCYKRKQKNVDRRFRKRKLEYLKENKLC